MDPNQKPISGAEQQPSKGGIETIACPNCGLINSILRDECETCGADLSVAKNILNNANRHYNTALEMAKTGRNDEAIVELQAAIELWGRNPHYFNLLGTVYARKGIFDQAVKAWEQTLALDPSFEKAYQSISKARRVQLHVAEENRQRPYKVMAAGAALVAVAALVALLFLGIRVTAAGAQVKRLMAELSERPTASVVQALETRLESREAAVADLRQELGKAQAENELKEQQIQKLEDQNRLLASRAMPGEEVDASLLEAEQKQREELETRVAQLQQEIQTLNTRLAAEEAGKVGLEEQLEQSKNALQQAEAARAALETKLQEAQAQTAQQKQRADEAEAELESLREESTHLQQALQEYEEGRFRAMLETLRLLSEPKWVPSALVARMQKEGEEQIRMQEDPLFRARRQAAEAEARQRDLAEREYYAGLKVERAKPLMEQGEYAEAIPLLKEAGEIMPWSETVQALLEQAERGLRIAELSAAAEAAESAGQVEQALVHYRQWLILDPDNRTIDRTIGRIERDERRRLETYQRFMETGSQAAVEGDFVSAIEAFEQAGAVARLPEEQTKALSSVEEARKKRQEQLEAEARRAAELDAALEAADAYYRQEEYPAALDEVRKALEVDPSSREARRLGNLIDRAIRDERQRRISVLEQEAKHLEESHQHQAMRETYLKILELDPGHRAARRALEQWEQQQEAERRRREEEARQRQERLEAEAEEESE